MVEKIDLRPKVLELIKINGPLIPREIAKELGHDTFIIGAVLAQLRDSGDILSSNTKVGGSPAYYIEGQEERLQLLDKYLDYKSKEAYDLLKENKVLRDYAQNVQVRFSLRQLKDFAIDLTVDVHGTDEIFWKWYLTPVDEVESLIMDMIKIPEEEEEPVKKETTLQVNVSSYETKIESLEVKHEGVKEIVLEEDLPEEKFVEVKEPVLKEDNTKEIEKPALVKKEKVKKAKKELSSSVKKSSKHKAKHDKPVKKEEKKGFFDKIKGLFK